MGQYAADEAALGFIPRHRECLEVSRPLRSGLVLAAAVAAAFAAEGRGSAACAQGKVDARYAASLAGLPIGRGAWVIDIGDDKYLAAASGATAGLMRLFSGGEGTGASRGSVVNGQLVSSSYASSISSSRRVNEVRIDRYD